MKKVVVYICLTAFLFGTMEVALKIAGSTFDPFQITFLRFMIGGLTLAPFGIVEMRNNNVHLDAKLLGWICLVGIMGIPISMLAFQLGVARCNASTASSLICLNPLFTIAIAHVFTDNKINKLKAIACTIGVIAAIFMIRPWDIQPGNTALGMILMLFASATFAAYSVMGKRSIAQVGTFAQTSIGFIAGSLVLLVFIIATGRPVFEGITANPLPVLYCGIVVTGIGYLFYFLAIKASDATTGAIAFYIKPAVAPILAVVILHETIYWNTVVGIVLLITASLISLKDAWAGK